MFCFYTLFKVQMYGLAGFALTLKYFFTTSDMLFLEVCILFCKNFKSKKTICFG